MDRRKKYKKMYGNVPENFIDESIKIDRHISYSKNKDPLGRALYFGNENDLYQHKIAVQIINKEKNKESSYPYLEKALKKLKAVKPMEYETLYSYYLSDDPKNIKEIAAARGISKQAVSKMLANARKHLKTLVIYYKNKK